MSQTRRVAVLSGLAVLAAGALVACSSSGGSSAPAPSTAGSTSAASTGSTPAGPVSTSTSSAATGGSDTVQVKDFAFQPATLTVPAGTKVTWDFVDTADHTVSDDAAKILSDSLHQGQTFSYTFTKAGTYAYICSIHPYMHGTVVVK